MEPAARAEQILVESDAILREDHFVYLTGQHGDGWVAKDAVFPYTDGVDELCGMLAEAVSDRDYDYVCGPATGGLIVAQWVAHHLRRPAVFAEHARRETADAVRDAGGEVVTVACLCTRGNAAADEVGSPDFVWLTEVLVPSWPAVDCPLCRDGVPVNTQYAHGADFLAQQGGA